MDGNVDAYVLHVYVINVNIRRKGCAFQIDKITHFNMKEVGQVMLINQLSYLLADERREYVTVL